MRNNEQPTERRVKSNQLQYVKVWRSIQGEGPFSGVPAVFVRLAGCNLQCQFCDTDYTSGRQSASPNELLTMVNQLVPPDFSSTLVVITGGEPFRQTLRPFVQLLLQAEHTVQIETNGTLYEDLGWNVEEPLFVVCSPKTPYVNSDLVPHIYAWKYVLEADYIDENDGLPTRVLGGTLFQTPIARPGSETSPSEIYVQPLDVRDPVQNKRHAQATAEVALRHNYRLGSQMHKLFDLE
jgi:7-carboxy-7-deazaguanine synthase